MTLEGTVGRRRQLDAAEQAVRRVPGVVHVINDITVTPKVAIRPATVRAAVEQALDRHTEREADRLDIFVADGTVTLAGTVDTLAEKRAVVGAAGHVPGVRAVIDELRVDHGGGATTR
ncbi:MAG: BON domain-containing protein [Dehalococcoidia bacterium]